MPSDNVEIARRFFELVGPADIESVEASEPALRELAAEHTGPDFEWVQAETGTPTREFDAILEGHRQWIEPWEEIHQELEELLDGGDAVMAVVHLRGRAKLSGVEAEMRTYFVFSFRDGKVVRVVEYLEREEALAAAGLAEG